MMDRSVLSWSSFRGGAATSDSYRGKHGGIDDDCNENHSFVIDRMCVRTLKFLHVL